MATASPLWNKSLGKLRVATPAVAGGVVYAGDTTGTVYALRAPG